ncbi:MAG: hypothetical protein ACAH80_12100 [Alphaproteobacteria bacterium]
MLKNNFRNSVAALSLCAALAVTACAPGDNWAVDGRQYSSTEATARRADSRALPTLVTTNEPAPDIIYRRGSRDTVLANGETADSVRKPRYYTSNVETLVTRKVNELNRDLFSLQRTTGTYQERLQSLQAKSDTDAAQYYELVAAINTELQSGTTPGNPILIERWNLAQNKLQNLSDTAGYLNGLAADLSNEASKAAYLQETVRSTYGLSGAVKQDHEQLRQLEDHVNQEIVNLNRLLTSTNDEISRRSAYLRTEHLNMQTLSLAISNGELYGQNISNTLFKSAADGGRALSPMPSPAASTSRRPLVIIRFDRANVNYEEALYSAVSQALDKYPTARFDLVAVSPSKGNPAELALASSEARKNGEAVFRSLTQMGLPAGRVQLNSANSTEARNSEVHIFIQ